MDAGKGPATQASDIRPIDEELEGDQFHFKYLKSYCRTEIESYL